MAECLLGLGSNLGDRVANLQAALHELQLHPRMQLVRHSSFIETAPAGGPEGQDPYFNAAAHITTELTPQELVTELLAVEAKHGRVREEPWGPRTIDLDLLLYDQEVHNSSSATVPHPRFAGRRFVLIPAAEIAGDWRHPGVNRRIRDLLSDLPPPSAGELGIKIFFSPQVAQSEILALRQSGRRIGIVPTMGALHAGHLSLVAAARQHSDYVIATIFVNPTQFGPHEDFSKYPRTLDADIKLLAATQCDMVFVPTAADMYPPGFSTFVQPPDVSKPFEGVCRPDHFRGVTTVVLKLFNVLPAHLACFGQKDYQQLQVIRQMVRDLDLPIEILAGPTVRETDGLALSSRNRYLSPAQRQQALSLSRALDVASMLLASGERSAATIVAQMRDVLVASGIERIDYIALADPQTLAEIADLDRPAVALIAAYVGTTRLIDNRLLTPNA